MSGDRFEAAHPSTAAWFEGTSSTLGVEDALDVSLHDSELADEVELTALLMVAVNDADGRLDPRQVDEILGVQRLGRTHGPVPRVPEQVRRSA